MLYYFQCRTQGKLLTLAVISVYSEPHPGLLKASHGTFISCRYFRDNSLVVVDVPCIQAVVAMIPHSPPDANEDEEHYFLVERPGLDVADLGGADEIVTES